MNRERNSASFRPEDMGIKIIDGPSLEQIKNLNRTKFTGITVHYGGRLQPFDAWHKGEIVRFTETIEQAASSVIDAQGRERNR